MIQVQRLLGLLTVFLILLSSSGLAVEAAMKIGYPEKWESAKDLESVSMIEGKFLGKALETVMLCPEEKDGDSELPTWDQGARRGSKGTNQLKVYETEGLLSQREIPDTIQPHLPPLKFLPKILTMGGFVLKDITYAPNSVLESLSGKAKSLFMGSSPYPDNPAIFHKSPTEFALDFQNLKAEWTTGDSAKITMGEIKESFQPAVIVIVAGYKLYVESIHLWPDEARGSIAMETNFLYDAAGCGTGLVLLKDVNINPTLDLYEKVTVTKLGPYQIGNTGILAEFFGDIIVDLSATQSAGVHEAGFPDTMSPELPSWRGIIFRKGKTVPRSGFDPSNIGYLYGKYNLTDAILTTSGLHANLELEGSFKFSSLAPMSFLLSLSKGWLEIQKSQVREGEFTGKMELPAGENGVKSREGSPIHAEFAALRVDSLLNLSGTVKLNQEIRWGGFGFVSCKGAFRLKADPQRFSPPVEEDDFKIYSGATLDTLTGLTFMVSQSSCKDTLVIYTKDAKKPLRLSMLGFDGSWLNLEMQGLSGEIRSVKFDDGQTILKTNLGLTSRPGYLSKEPFVTTLIHSTDDSSWVRLWFAGNSTFNSDLGGEFEIPYPCNIKPTFRKLGVTSTASVVGGNAAFSPLNLEYWGVGISSERGVVSVRTGEIVYTDADIIEPVHFSEPFNVIWGEMLADGNLGKFCFNNNSGNQKFDGFHFTLDTASLSPYQEPTGDLWGYLRVSGGVHLPFWGGKNITVTDYKYSNHNDSPFSGRYVTIDPPSFSVERDWGSGRAHMNFDVVSYDEDDQNGFQGSGEVVLLSGLSGSIASKIDLSSVYTNICYCSGQVEAGGGLSSSGTLRVGATSGIQLGPVGGCIQIIDGELERIYVEGPFEVSGGVGLIEGLSLEVDGNVLAEITPRSVSFGSVTTVSIVLPGEVGLYGMAGIKLILADTALQGDIVGHFNTYPVQQEVDGHLSLYLGFGSSASFYFQGTGKVALRYLWVDVQAEGAFLVAANALRSELWSLDEIGRNITANTVLDRMKVRPDALLTGIYAGAKLSTQVNLGVISGNISIWGGGGALSDDDSPPQAMINAEILIEGSVMVGLISASLWAEIWGMAGLPDFEVCGGAGFEACCCWELVCFGWGGDVCISSNGITTR